SFVLSMTLSLSFFNLFVFFFISPPSPLSTLFPYTTLFRSFLCFFCFWTDTPAPPRPAPLDMRATGWTWEGRKGYNSYEGKVSIKRCTLLCGAFLFVLDR